MRHTIVCLSSQPWHDGMWTNKQHIMSRLAAEHRVLYVDFGFRRFGELARRKLKSVKPRQRLQQLLRPAGLLLEPAIQTTDGVAVMEFAAPPPRRAQPGDRAWIQNLFELRLRLLERYLRRQRIDDAILWVYHPGYGAEVARIPKKLLVYDCVDEYSAFPTYRDNPGWLIERERALCAAADVVFATSQGLYEKKRRYNPSNTYLVHNVGDAAHFARARDTGTVVPAELASLPRPIVGFVGAVSDYKLNADWLIELAQRRADASVVIVGPVGVGDPSTTVERLERQPNIHLLGHRAYSELPAYLKGFDVATIPYRINGYTRYVFPIKFFELLASGKPVVISNLPALRRYYDLVHVASNSEQFVAACERALEGGDAGLHERIRVAEDNSWEARIEQLLRQVEQRLDQ